MVLKILACWAVERAAEKRRTRSARNVFEVRVMYRWRKRDVLFAKLGIYFVMALFSVWNFIILQCSKHRKKYVIGISQMFVSCLFDGVAEESIIRMQPDGPSLVHVVFHVCLLWLQGLSLACGCCKNVVVQEESPGSTGHSAS